MTAQQLRNSILQQAFQGRLVPQDPNDEPASVLLEKIRVEKSKKGKASKKELAIAQIAEEDYPYLIPSSWRWERFGNIVYNRDAERIPLSVAARVQHSLLRLPLWSHRASTTK